MYVWNGFTIVGKRADSTEALLVTIETAEEQLRNDSSEFKKQDAKSALANSNLTGIYTRPTSLQFIQQLNRIMWCLQMMLLFIQPVAANP